MEPALLCLALLLAPWLAWSMTRRPRGARVACALAGAFWLLYAMPLVASWALHGGPSPFRDENAFQLGVVLATALLYVLVPAGLLRPFAGASWAAGAAALLALVMPCACFVAARLAGGALEDAWTREARLSDLLFLDVAALAEGVTRGGRVQPAVRVHALALLALAHAALGLQALPRGGALRLARAWAARPRGLAGEPRPSR